MRTYYLAHSVFKRFYVRDRLIPALRDHLQIEVFNPFADRPFLFDELDENATIPEIVKNRNMKTHQEIVQKDLDDIVKCDGVIALISDDVKQVGTMMEIFFASAILDKPVFTIFENPESELKLHTWLITLTHPIDLMKIIDDEFYRDEMIALTRVPQ